MEATVRPPAWKTLLAFAIIYFVWGSTFLFIRIGVREVPPLLLASMRFFVAGAVLFLWMRLKGTPSPSRREWLGASALAVCIFVVDYGCCSGPNNACRRESQPSCWQRFRSS